MQTVLGHIAAHKPPRIELVTDVAESCPLIEGNPTQLRQLLTHLLVDAIEANGADAGKVAIAARPEHLAAEAVREAYAEFELTPGRYHTSGGASRRSPSSP